MFGEIRRAKAAFAKYLDHLVRRRLGCRCVLLPTARCSAAEATGLQAIPDFLDCFSPLAPFKYAEYHALLRDECSARMPESSLQANNQCALIVLHMRIWFKARTLAASSSARLRALEGILSRPRLATSSAHQPTARHGTASGRKQTHERGER